LGKPTYDSGSIAQDVVQEHHQAELKEKIRQTRSLRDVVVMCDMLGVMDDTPRLMKQHRWFSQDISIPKRQESHTLTDAIESSILLWRMIGGNSWRRALAS
jgi:hypothetical protein